MFHYYLGRKAKQALNSLLKEILKCFFFIFNIIIVRQEKWI